MTMQRGTSILPLLILIATGLLLFATVGPRAQADGARHSSAASLNAEAQANFSGLVIADLKGPIGDNDEGAVEDRVVRRHGLQGSGLTFCAEDAIDISVFMCVFNANFNMAADAPATVRYQDIQGYKAATTIQAWLNGQELPLTVGSIREFNTGLVSSQLFPFPREVFKPAYTYPASAILSADDPRLINRGKNVTRLVVTSSEMVRFSSPRASTDQGSFRQAASGTWWDGERAFWRLPHDEIVALRAAKHQDAGKTRCSVLD